MPGRKYARRNLGHILVLGLGVSGKAVVDYLLPLVGKRVQTLTVLGGPSDPALEEWATTAKSEDVRILFDVEEAEGRFDICIASPGISQFSDFYRSAAVHSAAIISEVEFAWCESSKESRWVAVTGTNGKTTTTALIAHLLAASGLEAKAVGNIGDACITEVAHDAQDAPEGSVSYYVVETSSYQLASVNRFAPDVAVILGITPDHLSWHTSHEEYVKAKFKLLSHLSHTEGAWAILDATNDEVRAKVRELKALSDEERGYSYVPLGTAEGIADDMRARCGAENAAFVDGETGMLHVALRGEDHELGLASALQLSGTHNHLNALAAASAALALGVKPSSIEEALTTFKPLEHRIEPCGEVDGVAFYNDSKATNIDATLKALTAFLPKRPIVMLGGRDKGTDLAELVQTCMDSAKAVLCYGEAQERFMSAFAQAAQAGLIVQRATNFEGAFGAACALAEPGDIVLLSPACASFDEFSCFEERGDAFKALVRQRAGSARPATKDR